jgi:hypothetical protein
LNRSVYPNNRPSAKPANVQATTAAPSKRKTDLIEDRIPDQAEDDGIVRVELRQITDFYVSIKNSYGID